MSDSAWNELHRRAAANHGVFGSADLAWVGIPPSTFSDFAEAHGCEQRHRGAWTLPGTSWTFACQAACAITAVGRPVLITGEAGLHLMGAMLRRPATTHLLLQPTRSGRGHRRVIVHRTRRFHAIPSTRSKGLPVACVGQCLIDASLSLSVELICKLMAAACRLRLTDLPSLASYAQEVGRFQGSVSFWAAVTALGGEMVHSNPEQVARDALRGYEIGLHHEPFSVLRDGQPIAEIDLAMPDILYGVEVDGPHHDLPEQRRWDEERDQELRDLGWRIDRFRWEDVLADPAGFAERVAAVAMRRAHDG